MISLFVLSSADKVVAQNATEPLQSTGSAISAVESLPAWRWGSGTGNLYSNLGIGGQDIFQGITGIFATILFSLSSFIWTLLLGLANTSTNFFYSANLAGIVNVGYASVFNSIADSSLVGIVIFILLAGSVFRLLTSSLRDLGLKQLISGFIFLGIFMFFGFQASNAVGDQTFEDLADNQIQGPGNTTIISDRGASNIRTPGGLTIALVSTANGVVSNLASDLLLFGSDSAVSAPEDILHCNNYQNSLNELWETNEPLDPGNSNLNIEGFSKSYLSLVSEAWASSQYEMWKNAQFGSNNPFGDKAGCWLIESDLDGLPLGREYIAFHVGGPDGSGITSVDGISQASIGDVGEICRAALRGTLGFAGGLLESLTGPVCIPADELNNIRDGEGEILIHATEEIFRRNMIAFASCTYNRSSSYDPSSVGVFNDTGEEASQGPWGEQVLGNGKDVQQTHCQDWLENGETTGVGEDEDNPWSYSTGNDIRSATVNSPQVRDYILNLNGHNNAAPVFAFYSLLTALVMVWYIGRMSIGLIIASVASVLYGIFAPIFLLFIASQQRALKEMGIASMRRWFSAVFATTAITLFLTAVIFANRIMNLIITSLVGSGAFSGSDIIQPFLLSLSTIAAFYMLTSLAKKSNLSSLTTVKGMRDWGAQSYTSANNQQNWQNQMGIGSNSGFRGALKQSYRTGALRDIRENSIESLIREDGVFSDLNPVKIAKKATGIGLTPAERAKKKDKGKEHPLDVLRKEKPQFRNAESSLKGSITDKEYEMKKLAEAMENADSQEQKQTLQDKQKALSKKLKEDKAELNAMHTSPKRYNQIKEAQTALSAKQAKLSNSLKQATEDGDQEEIDKLNKAMNQTLEKQNALNIEKEMLSEGFITDRKKNADALNRRILTARQHAASLAPPTSEIARESIQDKINKAETFNRFNKDNGNEILTEQLGEIGINSPDDLPQADFGDSLDDALPSDSSVPQIEIPEFDYDSTLNYLEQNSDRVPQEVIDKMGYLQGLQKSLKTLETDLPVITKGEALRAENDSLDNNISNKKFATESVEQLNRAINEAQTNLTEAQAAAFKKGINQFNDNLKSLRQSGFNIDPSELTSEQAFESQTRNLDQYQNEIQSFANEIGAEVTDILEESKAGYTDYLRKITDNNLEIQQVGNEIIEPPELLAKKEEIRSIQSSLAEDLRRMQADDGPDNHL